MDSIGFIGFACATAAYFLFALLLFAAKNNSLLARWLLISTLITVSANVVASFQVQAGFSLLWVMFADSIKIAAWSIMVLLCTTENLTFSTLLKHKYIRQYVIVWLGLVLVSWGVTFTFGHAYDLLFFLFVILNLWMLVLLEQLYRSANSQVRWALWPLVIALASISLFDFVLYAQAAMVNAIDFEFWYTRGFIATIVVPLLLISTRRVKNGTVRIFVSRNVVFYSSMLMIAGAYLLIMALAGYVINYIGGEWGSVFSLGFLVLGSIVLVTLFLTETLRRRVKVFIAKNFFANKYEYRDEWLNLIEKIETSSSENHYQMSTQIMMSKVGAHCGAIIKQITPTSFDTKYADNYQFDDMFIPELIHLSHFCKKEGWIVDIAEYKQTPTIYPDLSINTLMFDEKNIGVVVPIFIGKAFYGFFMLGTDKPMAKLNWEDRDLLSAVSKQLGNFVSLHEANDRLAESKQFEAFHRMSAFLVHDLKNVQAQLSLITTNAEKHRHNPEFIDDVFETVDSATERLDKVLSQLRNKQVVHSKQRIVDIKTLVLAVVNQCNIRLPKVSLDINNTCSAQLDEDTFYAVLNHVIQNAQEATEKSGWVKVTVRNSDSELTIDVEDNGCGMSPEFIENRLFKPFDTTKGNAGMGIGVYEAKQYFESIAGTIKVTSDVNHGTKFMISLPLLTVNE